MYATTESRLKENPTFLEFIISCARETEMFSHMKGMPKKAKLIKREYDKDYIDKLNQGKKNLKEFTQLMPQDYHKKVLISRKEEIDRLQEEKKRKDKIRAEYTELLMEVKGWKPPTEDHIEIKRKMLQGIESGIALECNQTFEDERIAELSEKFNLNELFAQQVDKIEDDIKFMKEKVAEDKSIVDYKNRLIDEFVDSLKLTPEQREKFLDF